MWAIQSISLVKNEGGEGVHLAERGSEASLLRSGQIWPDWEGGCGVGEREGPSDPCLGEGNREGKEKAVGGCGSNIPEHGAMPVSAVLQQHGTKCSGVVG